MSELAKLPSLTVGARFCTERLEFEGNAELVSFKDDGGDGV